MTKRTRGAIAIAVVTASIAGRLAWAGEQPIAIFHAFDQSYVDVQSFVCDLAAEGYSHVQIAPAQKSNPSDQWWARYQPIDYGVIKGRGTEADLEKLTKKAHGCGLKVIADVVFNHMADTDEFHDLKFPGIAPSSFHSPCPINYDDGNRDTEMNCRLGSLPDLDQTKADVQNAQKQHLEKLMKLGVDGFRFDAAKHMPAGTVKAYIDYIDQQSHGNAWNYLEVIEDHDTRAEDYNGIAAVTDFLLYRSMKSAFNFGGDLRSLRVADAVDDARSVTFGRNHDNIKELNDKAIDPYTDRTDSFLATAFALARAGGTPLILNWDNADAPFVKYGVMFRRIMADRARAGANVKDNVLAVIDSPTLLVMERGGEGFFVVNKAAALFDVPVLDLTLTNLEGCYRELRNNFVVAVERRGEKKFVTRWGTAARGGMQVQGRDAMYFVRDPWSECQTR